MTPNRSFTCFMHKKGMDRLIRDLFASRECSPRRHGGKGIITLPSGKSFHRTLSQLYGKLELRQPRSHN